jgi:hypothetical protein
VLAAIGVVQGIQLRARLPQRLLPDRQEERRAQPREETAVGALSPGPLL